ncbi:hypothetical protein FGG08_002824 [Glutinoglossum americanum]|uniref:Uncharacterized protein n=1 Tax=Glutinoglossum americanum TaxID=1670608 RepID=A0A9P8IAU7_9PEZI|nr:hypothetical protein FGG08_002824 [Glutinoglossum americanum]
MSRETIAYAKSVVEQLIAFFESAVEGSQRVLTYLYNALGFLNRALQQGVFTAAFKQAFQTYIQRADAAGMPRALDRKGRGDLRLEASKMEQEIDCEVPDPPETIIFEGEDIKNTEFIDRDQGYGIRVGEAKRLNIRSSRNGAGRSRNGLEYRKYEEEEVDNTGGRKRLTYY